MVHPTEFSTTHQAPAAVRVSAASPRDRVVMSARGLHKAFAGQVVLDGVDFDLHEGEVVLLRGPNGSGKTTLLNVLTGYLAPDAGVLRLMASGTSEDFEFPRRWWQDLNPFDHFLPERVAREGVGRSWQDTRLFSSIPLVDNVTAAAPKHPGENPWNVLFRPGRVRAAEAAARESAHFRLADLGLTGRDDSSGDKVSLGQSKRVAIARAVQGGAKILFLDEPLSGLDLDGIRSVTDLLRSLVQDHRMTLVIIEHVWNVRYVEPLADTVWDLQDGRLSIGSSHVAEPATGPTGHDVSPIPGLFPEFSLSRSIELPRGARLDIYRRPGDNPATNVLEVEDLVVRRGSRLIVGKNDSEGDPGGIDFSIRTGELAVLQAPNGWGKTTLLDALAGLLPAERGVVRLAGQDLAARPAWERSALGLRYLRSDSKGFASLNVDEVLRAAGRSAGENFNIDPRLRYGQLSGGEKRRVQLQTVRPEQARFFMFDEPFSALDEHNASATLRAILQFSQQVHTAILIAIPAITAVAHN